MAWSRLAAARERPAGEGARQGGLERRADGLGRGRRRRARGSAAPAASPACERDRRRGATRPCGGQRQPHRVGARLPQRRRPRAAPRFAEREPAAGEAARGRRRASSPAIERHVRLRPRTSRAARSPRGGRPVLEQRGGERDRRPAADVAARRACCASSTLSCAAVDRGVEVAGGERDLGARVEAPRDRVGVAGQPCGLDRAVERLDRLAERPLKRQTMPRIATDEREQLALTGGAADGRARARRARPPSTKRSR